MHRGAAHAKARIARGLAGTQENHDPRSGPAMPPRKGQPQVQGGCPRPTTGRRPRQRAHRDGNGPNRLHHRRVRSEDRRMARLNLDDDQLRPRRPQPGHLPTTPGDGSLTHHSDRGMHCVSIRYANRLTEAGIDMSAGSIGDSTDNALAETVIGLFKTEVVKHLSPWKTKACSNGKP